ncbi:uncharacterized protein LOC124683198 isoform X2 [Lolium rigidum]|nr:uncharacterized protein LOC124683198 isoform X2 [Lolium rigidum]
MTVPCNRRHGDLFIGALWLCYGVDYCRRSKSCSVLPPRVDLNAWSRREGPSTATLSSKFGCSLTSATKGRLEHVYVRLKCCFSMVAAMKQVFCR